MVAPPDDGQHFRLECRPIVHDPQIAGAKNEITLRHERAVPAAIRFALFGRRVPGVAIELDHKPLADEQVDSSDSADCHLRSQPYSSASETQTRQCLDSRFAATVCTLQCLASSGTLQLRGE